MRNRASVLLILWCALAACTQTEEPADERPTAATTVSTTATSVAAPPASTGAPDEPSPTAARWRLERVIDGDTVELLGPGGHVDTVRIVGINAPERKECYADEATDALRHMLDEHEWTLVTDTTDRDRYGRALRYIERSDPDGAALDVGAAMVRSGAARAYRYAPDVARADEYDELQADAEAAGVGLWAPDACGPPAVDRAAVELTVEFNYDPPGDESKDLNAEWARITNASDSALDLSG